MLVKKNIHIKNMKMSYIHSKVKKKNIYQLLSEHSKMLTGDLDKAKFFKQFRLVYQKYVSEGTGLKFENNGYIFI